jgi:hypothetical protein
MQRTPKRSTGYGLGTALAHLFGKGGLTPSLQIKFAKGREKFAKGRDK